MSQYQLRSTQVLPPIVKNLIIINVILAVAQHVIWASFHVSLADYLGLHYFRSEQFRPWQLVTHMFMHGDPESIEATAMHLFSNMFGLWVLGAILEQYWGPKRFLVFYLICGVGAALCQLGVMSLQYEPVVQSYQAYLGNTTLDQFVSFIRHHPPHGVDSHILDRINSLYASWSVDPGSTFYPKLSGQVLHEYIYGAPSLEGRHVEGFLDGGMVGASGAVMGVLFAFGYLFPNLKLMFLFLPVPIKAKWFVTIYAVIELFYGLRNSAGDNVAHFAHLGGMLFAFLLLKVWRYRFGDRHF